MKKDLQKAREILDAQDYTCVLCRGDAVRTATDRGVKPLLNWLDSSEDLRHFSAADRVVGRATAYLYCLLGVDAVYARVMSRPAAQVLEAGGIAFEAATLTDGIINRRGDGPCPFEAAVMDIHNAEDALAAIRARMAQL